MHTCYVFFRLQIFKLFRLYLTYMWSCLSDAICALLDEVMFSRFITQYGLQLLNDYCFSIIH